MKLLDRYLSAVRDALFLTPASKRNDILRELGEEIREQFEAREQELGRSLTENEADLILQRFGHPTIVAGRYREAQGTVAFGPQLIGPELFPIYRMILAINVALTAVLMAVLVWQFGAAVDVDDIVFHLALQAGIITVIFVAVEASMQRSIKRGWSMLATPEVHDRNRIPRSSSVVSLIVTIFFANIWMELPWYSKALRFSPGPEWNPGAVWNYFHSTFFVPVLLLMGVSMALSFANLIDPHRRPMKLWISATANLLFAAIIGFTLSVHWAALTAQLALIRSGDVLSIADKTSASINISVAWILGVFALVAVCQAIVEVVRASQLKSASESGSGQSIHSAAL